MYLSKINEFSDTRVGRLQRFAIKRKFWPEVGGGLRQVGWTKPRGWWQSQRGGWKVD